MAEGDVEVVMIAEKAVGPIKTTRTKIGQDVVRLPAPR